MRSHTLQPETVPALIKLIDVSATQVAQYGSLSRVPVESVDNVRNDMYLTSEAIRLMQKGGNPAFDAQTNTNLTAYKKDLDGATKFATDYLGLEVSHRGKDTIYFKSDEREHTLCYFEGSPQDQVAAFEVGSRDDLEDAG